jgi:hypothetical protein
MPAIKSSINRDLRYFAKHDLMLQNGSFYRDRGSEFGGYAHYMNGDFMGWVESIPDTFVLQERSHALRLLPRNCRV